MPFLPFHKFSFRISHPLAFGVYLSAFFSAVLVSSHPFYLAAFLISQTWLMFLVSTCFRSPAKTGAVLDSGSPAGIKGRQRVSWRRYAETALGISIFFSFLNVMVCQAGATVLWQSPVIPLFHTAVDVSLEELFYNADMAVRIFLLVCGFQLYHALQVPDSGFGFFSRRFPRATLTLTLGALLAARLGERAVDLRDALSARGADLTGGPFLTRTHAHLSLFRSWFLAALEESWHTAESLEARAFGSGGLKTCFYRCVWGGGDYLALMFGVFLWGWVIKSVWSGEGRIQFYPWVEPLMNEVNFFGLVLVWIAALAFPLLILFCGRSTE